MHWPFASWWHMPASRGEQGAVTPKPPPTNALLQPWAGSIVLAPLCCSMHLLKALHPNLEWSADAVASTVVPRGPACPLCLLFVGGSKIRYHFFFRFGDDPSSAPLFRAFPHFDERAHVRSSYLLLKFSATFSLFRKNHL